MSTFLDIAQIPRATSHNAFSYCSHSWCAQWRDWRGRGVRTAPPRASQMWKL